MDILTWETVCLLLHVLCLLITDMVLSEECQQLTLCSCKGSYGTVDLTTLSKEDNPRFTDTPGDGHFYKYQPCTALPPPCMNQKLGDIAICMEDEGAPYGGGVLGDVESAIFSGDPLLDTLRIEYRHTDSLTAKETITYVSLKCSKEDGTFKAKGLVPGETAYQLELKTKYACVDRPAPAAGGLGIGSIIVIAFFGLVFVYFIGGLLFLRFVRRARGTELIPNSTFWAGLPGYIKDGILFVGRRCRTDHAYQQI